MKAYFECEHGVLYHGDCVDIIPQLNRVDLVLTDPPYSQQDSKGGAFGSDKSRKGIAGEISSFNPTKFMEIWFNYSVNKHLYCFTSKNLLPKYLSFFESKKINWNLLIMRKRNPIPAKNNTYLPDIEYVIFTRGSNCYFNNNAEFDLYRRVQDIVVRPSKYGHPTEKQINHIIKYLNISSDKNHIILDPFAGSGTTGVACIETGRKFILIEKEKKYCDIIVDRLKSATFESRKIDLF